LRTIKRNVPFLGRDLETAVLMTEPLSDPLLDRSLADLACDVPGATALFHREQLDFCCGGHQTLREAVAGRGLDGGQLAEALRALQAQGRSATERDWRQARTGELIDHLLQRFHEGHRAQLPELIRLARRVESVHADHPDCPRGLADHLEMMAQDLEQHMCKEEQVLFPLLRHGGSPAFVAAPIRVMRHEHDQHGESLARLSGLSGGLRAPADACSSWQALATGLQALHSELTMHIHLENNVLFKGQAAAEAEFAAGGCCGGCGGSR
jgi:regulator of cell morphogenesis and NO signaling